MKVHVKICGVRSEAELAGCIEAAVDRVGFNFYRASPRYVDPGVAAGLVRSLPASMTAVGVFVKTPPDEVQRICAEAGITTVQLHGDEDVTAYEDLGLELLQVIRVRPEAKVTSLPRPVTSLAVLDTHVPGFGGEGRSMDWTLAAQLQRHWGVPLILAGGLSPENVQVAIRTARPWGVDVASGVEGADGRKDAQRVRAFTEAARSA